MPTPVFNVICVVAGICDLIISVSLMATSDMKTLISTVVFVGVCLVLPVIRLKSGAVSSEELEAKRRMIEEQALKATEE